MAPLGLGVTIEAGSLQDGSGVAAGNMTGIGAPAANPRIDRIYFNLNTKTFVRAVGVEAAVPVVPAAPYGVYLVCQVFMTVGMTAITNADIMDERTAVMAPLVMPSAGYTQVVDLDGLARILVGRAGYDNRVIVRLQTNDSSSRLLIQRQDGTPIFSIDGAGDVRSIGTITQSTTVTTGV